MEIGGRYANRDKLGYRWILSQNGSWQLNWQQTTLATGKLTGDPSRPAACTRDGWPAIGDSSSFRVEGVASRELLQEGRIASLIADGWMPWSRTRLGDVVQRLISSDCASKRGKGELQ